MVIVRDPDGHVDSAYLPLGHALMAMLGLATNAIHMNEQRAAVAFAGG